MASIRRMPGLFRAAFGLFKEIWVGGMALYEPVHECLAVSRRYTFHPIAERWVFVNVVNLSDTLYMVGNDSVRSNNSIEFFDDIFLSERMRLIN